MGHDTPRLEIERWLTEATAGLDPADAELIRQELELHIYDLLSDEIMSSKDPQREAAVSCEELADYLGTLNPSKREDLWRAVRARTELVDRRVRTARWANRLERLSLLGWIATATKGLCKEAQARIETEIRSHYTDAFEDGRKRGLPEPVAHVEAITSLGDPHIARRAFQKAYLTEAEDRMLRSILRDPKMPKRGNILMASLCAVPWVVMAFWRISDNGGNVWLVAALFMLSLSIGIATAGMLAPRLLKTRRFMLGLTIFLAGTAVAFLAMLLPAAYSYATDPHAPSAAFYFFSSLFLLWGFLALRVLPMIRKLGRKPDSTL